MFVARFVAAAFGVVAAADFCCAAKLRNKSLQQKSRMSSALRNRRRQRALAYAMQLTGNE